MTAATTSCWADPLTRAERRELAVKLARACKRLYSSRIVTLPGAVRGQVCIADLQRHVSSYLSASAEMADLHLDVTERAEVPAS